MFLELVAPYAASDGKEVSSVLFHGSVVAALYLAAVMILAPGETEATGAFLAPIWHLNLKSRR